MCGFLQFYRDLMVASNKRSIDEHIALLKWPSTHADENTLKCLEMLEDKYSPRIDLQGESYTKMRKLLEHTASPSNEV